MSQTRRPDSGRPCRRARPWRQS
uniref:Uncharacterized protein n=1 Tax=Arundo donax TaxID=35708 RepID=A0A0A9HM63_ARUDO